MGGWVSWPDVLSTPLTAAKAPTKTQACLHPLRSMIKSTLKSMLMHCCSAGSLHMGWVPARSWLYPAVIWPWVPLPCRHVQCPLLHHSSQRAGKLASCTHQKMPSRFCGFGIQLGLTQTVKIHLLASGKCGVLVAGNLAVPVRRERANRSAQPASQNCSAQCRST